ASLAMLLGGIYLVWAWFVGGLAVSSLVYGLLMLLWSLLGRHIVLAFYPHGRDKPHTVDSSNARPIEGADGSKLHIEYDGPPDGDVIVLTHGWALDSAAWYSVRRELAKTYRLVLWDLPGLGKSTQPADRRYSVERLALDLRAVIQQTGDRPVILVGHSIGG